MRPTGERRPPVSVGVSVVAVSESQREQRQLPGLVGADELADGLVGPQLFGSLTVSSAAVISNTSDRYDGERGR